jgi:hypothetical protein
MSSDITVRVTDVLLRAANASVVAVGNSGPQGPQGLPGEPGAGGALGYWGSFYDTTDQPLASVTAAQPISINSTAGGSGVSVVDSTKVTFANAGVYSLTFSIQITNAANSVEKAFFWLRLNGTDYPDSSTEIDLQARKSAGVPNRQVVTVNYVAEADAADYVQVFWSGSSTNLTVESLPAGTSPMSPNVPSIILTATQVMYTQLGPQGNPGAAATIAAGTTTTGAAGSSAAVTNAGTSSAAVFNFTIPRGDVGATGATGATGDTGPSGVVAVTAPITNSGTSTSANIGVTAGSTSAAGVLQLTDSTSSTSTTTAATANSVKLAVDRFEDYLHFSATALDAFPRTQAATTIAAISGRAWCTYVTIPYDLTVSQITFQGGATASSGLTVARFGLYAGGVLVAQTANDTTLFNTASTTYTRSFDTTGGFPATYTLTAGTRYGIAVIQVGTTAGSLIGLTSNISLNALDPRIVGITNGAADLPATAPTGNVASMIFGRLT